MKKYLVILLLLIACPAWGATYFVSQNGAGAKTGADVDNASEIATFNAGTAPYNVLDDDTVYLLDTITTAVVIPDSGTSGHIATIRGDYAGHPCTITGAIQALKTAKDYVTITGFNVVYNGVDVYNVKILINGVRTGVTIDSITIDGGGYGYGIAGDNNDSNIIISNITITDTPQSPIYFYGAANANITIENITAVSGHRIDLRNIYGLTLSNITKSGTTGLAPDFYIINCSGLLTATGLSSTNAKQYGIFLSGCNFTGHSIIEATVTGSSYAGIEIADSTGLAIQNSIFNDTTGPGIEIRGASHDIDIVNDTVSGSLSGAGSIWIAGGYNYKIASNTVINGASDGIGTSNATTPIHDVIVEYNFISGNGIKTTVSEGDGITSHYNDYNLTYRYNVIVNNTASGIGCGGNTHGWIYNNTIVSNGGAWFDLLGGSNLNGARGGIILPLGGINPITGTSWIVRNNIFKNNYPREVLLSSPAKDIVSFDYNLYNETTTSRFASLDNGATNITWAQYHTSPNTYETHSLNSDPLFISATNFHLQSGSPARGAGVNVGLVHLDPPDIGAEPYLQYVPWRH
jgi:hypothetical protein